MAVLLEILLMTAFAAVLLMLSRILPGPWTTALTLMFLIYAPLAILKRQNRSLSDFGYSLRLPSIQDSKLLFGFIGLTLAFFPVAFHVFQIVIGHRHFSGFYPGAWTDAPWITALRMGVIQLALVAFPEEVFFRGYLQTRLSEIPKLRGSTFLPVMASAGIFAGMHLIGGIQAHRLLTFFPGLLFGWLWAKSKNMSLPVIYHAFCNLLWIGLNSFYLG